MAHLLDYVRGEHAVAYVGDAWHGLGTKIDAPVSAAEMVRLARIDWAVSLQPVLLGSEPLPDHRAVCRSDRAGVAGVLGVVGKDYSPIQNEQCFSFADKIVGESQAIWHTAGAVRDGKDVWALCKLPGTLEIVPGDCVDKYLLFTNNHEGYRTARVRFTPIRVVCNNTLSAALGQGGTTAKVYHSGDLTRGFKNAADLLGIATKAFEDTHEVFTALAKKQLNKEEMAAYWNSVFPDPESGSLNGKTRARNMRGLLEQLYESGEGSDIPGVRGTAWGAYNSVTEYVDHLRLSGKPAENRLYSSWFSTGENLRGRALELAVALVA